MSNRYGGKCHACGKSVAAGAGELEKLGYSRRGGWRLWCMDCFNKSDNSGPEDRMCGDRAYEERCAEACGFERY